MTSNERVVAARLAVTLTAPAQQVAALLREPGSGSSPIFVAGGETTVANRPPQVRRRRSRL